MKKTTRPPHELRFAILAADAVLFTVHNEALQVRLIPVDLPPHFPNMAGLPGGLVAPNETAEQAALRHVINKGGLAAKQVYLEQLYTFSAIRRDPRGRVVAVAYLGLVPSSQDSEPDADQSKTWWSPISTLPKLAYDHRQIIQTGLERLRSRLTYTTLIQKLMPEEFTLTELEKMYEIVLDQDIDKRNFRKKVLKQNVLQELTRERTGEKHRPAKLYRFRSAQVTSSVII